MEAGKITTDQYSSRGSAVPTASPPYSDRGTFFDLGSGNIYSPNFALDGSNAFFKGTIHSDFGNIGGWNISPIGLTSKNNEIGLYPDKQAEGVPLYGETEPLLIASNTFSNIQYPYYWEGSATINNNNEQTLRPSNLTDKEIIDAYGIVKSYRETISAPTIINSFSAPLTTYTNQNFHQLLYSNPDTGDFKTKVSIEYTTSGNFTVYKTSSAVCPLVIPV